MKKILSFAALLLAFISLSWASFNFSAVAPSGQKLYYNISGSNVSVTYPGPSYDPWDSYPKPTGALTIPSTVTYNSQTYSVTSIDNYAFRGCYRLTSVTIPNSVTSIGNYAFNYCYSLTTVTIPNSVTYIGDDAFALVKNLVYDGTATGSPWGALCENGYIEGDLIYTDSSKTYLVGCATTATSVTIPNSVTSIGDWTFYGCSELTSVTIPNSVTSIGYYAFLGCSGLTSVAFNAINCTTMGYYSSPVFSECYNLSSLTIGDSVQTIPAYAFSGCSGLTSLSIPNSVTRIGDYAFYNCGGLRGILNINAVDSVMSNAFSGCNNVVSLTLGSGLRYIGSEAFSGMERMTNITCKAENAPYVADINAFSSIPSNTPVTIPCNALSNYQYAYGWSLFTNFQSTMLYALDVASADPSRGGVTIITQPTCDNAQAQFQANAYNGYHFDHWSDGNTDNPRYLVLTGDTAIFAYFLSDQDFTITVVSADPTMGSVTGSGTFADGTTTTITATANTGYRFVQWQDGNTEHIRTITVTADATYTAYFEADGSQEGIADAADKAAFVIRTTGTRIVVEGIANETVRLFDCMGRCLQTLQGTEPCTLQAPAPGVYMLQVGDHPAQKVVVVR